MPIAKIRKIKNMTNGEKQKEESSSSSDSSSEEEYVSSQGEESPSTLKEESSDNDSESSSSKSSSNESSEDESPKSSSIESSRDSSNTGDKSQSSSKQNLQQCEYCGKKVNYSAQAMSGHLAHCDVYISTNMVLGLAGQKPSLTCRYCGKTFKERKNLNKHERIFHTDKIFDGHSFATPMYRCQKYVFFQKH